jgi:hypothetical protein
MANNESMQNQPAMQTAPKKKKKAWLWILIVAVVIIIAGIAAGLFGLTSLFSGPTDPAKQFITDLSTGNTEAAYAKTANVFKEATTEAQFNEFLVAFPLIGDVKEINLSSVNIENDVANVSGSVTTNDGTVSPVEVVLVKEGGDWKVASLDLQPDSL